MTDYEHQLHRELSDLRSRRVDLPPQDRTGQEQARRIVGDHRDLWELARVYPTELKATETRYLELHHLLGLAPPGPPVKITPVRHTPQAAPVRSSGSNGVSEQDAGESVTSLMTPEPTPSESAVIDEFADGMAALVNAAPQAKRDGVRKALGGVYGMLLALRRQVRELQAREVPKYVGVWHDNGKYQPGTMVTDSGSLFYCKAETTDRPGKSDAWQLCVKRGRDGRDLRSLSDWRAKDIEAAIARSRCPGRRNGSRAHGEVARLGYTNTELPVVLRPMLDELAEIRARQVAELEAMLPEHAPPRVEQLH